MTMNATGAISLAGTTAGQSIEKENGGAGTTAIALNCAAVRSLAGVPSGAITFANFYGKSNSFAYTISANQLNYCLHASAVAAGWNSSAKLTVTINSGVYIYSNSTGVPALTISGTYAGGLYVINNGTIVGMGGGGGGGGLAWNGGAPAGGGGGTGVKASSAVNFTNNGTIAGGGGGGGGGVGTFAGGYPDSSGGGGGGGRSSLTNSGGGAAPAACSQGTAGGVGTLSAAGTGGCGGSTHTGYCGCSMTYTFNYYSTSGGNGGGWGAAGSAGVTSTSAGGAGGAGGKATCGTANITWAATGTRYGSIS